MGVWALAPMRRMGAGVLIIDGAERVLLVKPTYKPEWEIPGGLVEQDESPREAAARECREELGRDVAIGDLLCLQYVASTGEYVDGLMFVFDGGLGVGADDYVLPPGELSEAAFVNASELAAFLPSVLLVRMLAVLCAKQTGQTAYLERQ
jgi:8-oxo-dGTP diphosphatase